MQKVLINKKSVNEWPQIAAKAVKHPAFTQDIGREWFWAASSWIEKTAIQAGEVSSDVIHFALLERPPVEGAWGQWIKDNLALHERLSLILLSAVPSSVLPGVPMTRPFLSGAMGFLLLTILNIPLLFIAPEWNALWFGATTIPAFVVFLRMYKFKARTLSSTNKIPWLVIAADKLPVNVSFFSEDFQALLISLRVLIARAHSYPDSWWDAKGKYDVESVLGIHIPQLLKEYESLSATQRATHHLVFLAQLRSLCVIVQKQVELLSWLQNIEIAARTRYLNSRLARS